MHLAPICTAYAVQINVVHPCCQTMGVPNVRLSTSSMNFVPQVLLVVLLRYCSGEGVTAIGLFMAGGQYYG